MHAPINHDLAAIATNHLATPLSSTHGALHGRRVLILDDDPLAGVIASLDLEDASAPFVLVHDEASAHAALDRSIENGELFDAAVLDVNLGAGRTSRTVAERLHAMGVPFVLHTAEPDALPDSPSRGPKVRTSTNRTDAPIIGKPAPAGALAHALEVLVAPGR